MITVTGNDISLILCLRAFFWLSLVESPYHYLVANIWFTASTVRRSRWCGYSDCLLMSWFGAAQYLKTWDVRSTWRPCLVGKVPLSLAFWLDNIVLVEKISPLDRVFQSSVVVPVIPSTSGLNLRVGNWTECDGGKQEGWVWQPVLRHSLLPSCVRCCGSFRGRHWRLGHLGARHLVSLPSSSQSLPPRVPPGPHQVPVTLEHSSCHLGWVKKGFWKWEVSQPLPNPTTVQRLSF